MSEKNAGHNGAQWTKAMAAEAAAATAAALTAQQKQHHPLMVGHQLQQQPQQQHQRLYNPATAAAALMPAHTSIYGMGVGAGVGGTHSTLPHPHAHAHAHPDGIATYASARFHPPPLPTETAAIQHASVAAHQHPHQLQLQHQPPTHAPTTVLTAPASASPNVPVQSGFVPPPLLPTAAAAVAVAAATSVLTPNPFAGTAPLEQFSHLNLQQQLELNKIMNAMNTSVTAANVSPVGASTSSNNGSNSQQSSTRLHGGDVPMTSAGATAQITSSVSGGSGIGGSTTPVGTGAISNTIAENVLNAISATPNSSVSASVPAVHGRLMGIGVKMPDDDKLHRIQQVVESGISESAKQQIQQIVDRVSTLKPIERLLLYLRLPGEAPETDPLRHPQNPLGTRSEINHTINWVRSHLEHDPKVSIPKQDVYNDYIAYCERLDIKPLSTADFGKVMKQVFPGIRPRRLGTRGHSRYCYAAMRKTTKLSSPLLPQLDSHAVNEMNITDGPNATIANSGDEESWQIIRSWAASLFNEKVDSVQELASCIKSKGVEGAGGGMATQTRVSGVTHKKYAAREPKEKRLLADHMGPLKKRRKKKRKGSSSSESSCSQPQQSQQPNILTSDTQLQDVKHQTPNEVIQIKQEILESPNLQRVQHMAVSTQLPQTATIADSYLQQQQHQQQMLPMNLVTEQRTVLARAPPAGSAFGTVQPQQQQRASFTSSGNPSTTAVKNLTPKIIELSTAASTLQLSNAAITVDQPTIKEEEFSDEYNPNIICKKVRKAQQTKGFWANSPTPNNLVVPTITTTPVTTAMTSPSSSLSVATSVIAAAPLTTAVATGDLMGPPAQISSINTAISPSNALIGDTNAPPTAASPKVVSRNMLQLRAKRLQIAAAVAAEAAANASGSLPDGDAADLSSNLGLPRERVISICNMDKHELDDYFLPGEEEEPEDQDTELLQYFQTRDAEEKVNSLDAVKPRNPTAPSKMALSSTKVLTSIKDVCRATKATTQENNARSVTLAEVAEGSAAVTTEFKMATTNATSTTQSQKTIANIVNVNANNVTTMRSTKATPPAVGSASASLTLLSQKHQQQNQIRKLQTQMLSSAGGSGANFKLKINLANTTINPADIMATRKNCIFLPISPNINNTGNNNNHNSNINGCTTTSSVSVTNCSNNNSSSFFVSPGLNTQRVRPKPSFPFGKQLSLESDSSDPMIGASHRRRSYASLMPNCNIMPTSASAPPSPSVLQQQQHSYGGAMHFLGNTCQQLNSTANNGGNAVNNVTTTYNDVNNASAAAELLATEQNSLDLDMFSAVAAGGMDYEELALDELTTPLNEIQRSQSVPLSQLQRIHSPAFSRTFQAAHYSACTSVAQTPVPHEFADSSTLFSENSCSQNSAGGMNGNVSCKNASGNNAVTGKLDEAVVLASDSSAMLDDVDVSEMFSVDFETKFPNIAQANAATTTCSSAGSSSGYSSSACTAFGSAALIASNGVGTVIGSGVSGGGTTLSRSVPSTPLPHQQHHSPFTNFYGGKRRLDEEIHLSPLTTTGTTVGGVTFATGSFKYGNGATTGGTSGCGYDISRSMPSTPTTTPRFCYSPKDFLSNGNTIDSMISGVGGGGGGSGSNAGNPADSAPSDGLNVALASLNNRDALLDESCMLSTDAFGSNAVTDAENMMADTDLLDNL